MTTRNNKRQGAVPPPHGERRIGRVTVWWGLM
jgi:hypothetical protein